jgi:metallophosphoesterase superfamily enzyme
LLEVDGWTIVHGHRAVPALRTIAGHDHPVLRTGAVSVPCFLVSPRAIVLPAFSANAAGLSVMSPHRTHPDSWRGRSLRCVVACGSEWLDFGCLTSISRRLRSSRNLQR